MSKKFEIFPCGGIGDTMIITPSVKALKETHPDHKIIVYYKQNGQKDVFLNNPNVDSLRDFRKMSFWRYYYRLSSFFIRKKTDPFVVLFQHIPPSWIYKVHVIDIVAEIFKVKLKSRKIELFFTKDEENRAKQALKPFKNTVIMHIHSKSSQNHHWELENWEELIKQLPDYTFIQLGLKTEPEVKGALDWRGKTLFREALCLLKYADSFVGVDSNMAHATNAFDMPGVVLFGDSSPVHWGKPNNINIYKEVECSPCYYELWHERCPYGHECMKLITVEDVKKALIQQMNRRLKEKNI